MKALKSAKCDQRIYSLQTLFIEANFVAKNWGIYKFAEDKILTQN